MGVKIAFKSAGKPPPSLKSSTFFCLWRNLFFSSSSGFRPSSSSSLSSFYCFFLELLLRDLPSEPELFFSIFMSSSPPTALTIIPIILDFLGIGPVGRAKLLPLLICCFPFFSYKLFEDPNFYSYLGAIDLEL